MDRYPFRVKQLGIVDYEPTWHAMQALTAARHADTEDEVWLLQHPAVYTLGLAGKPEHLLQSTQIPLVHSDRGGQITYHGPGQLVVYLLLDVKRYRLGVRELVRRIEQTVIHLLAEWGIVANGDVARPGIYVDGAKIASLGLRVKNGATYHGLALNVDLDLTPFASINPCGYANLPVTSLAQLGVMVDIDTVAARLLPHLAAQLDDRAPRNRIEGIA